MAEQKIQVYADWLSETPALIGLLYIAENRGREIFSFEFSKDYLQKDDGMLMLDPDLSFFAGRQYTPIDKPIFGMFADVSPDRWGRLLMKRREAIIARREERRPRTLLERDFLLGVYDETRMGALRFATEEGIFLSSSSTLKTPPIQKLRSLENAAIAFENGNNPDEEKWLTQLLAPGSSLGGARPKATVTTPDGSLWIAKFPSKHDEENTGAWEAVTHDVAEKCGICVPQAKLYSFTKSGSTYLSKRFDRNGKKRIHFASAMTMLGKTDGDESASYLDIAQFLQEYGAFPKRDLPELWSRLVYNIAVSNTDDHLRNHGFLLAPNGWELAPAFDINPSIYGDSLSLNITPNENTLDFNLAMETASFYGLSLQEAANRLEDICKTVCDTWESCAKRAGINKEEINHMAAAFDMSLKGKKEALRRTHPVSLECEAKTARESSAALEGKIAKKSKTAQKER